MVGEVQVAAAKAAGWHGWLWKMRLHQAQAEMAIARGDADAALVLAGETLDRSQATGRVKYQAAALGVRARALLLTGRKHDAILALQDAVMRVRPMKDPALLFRTIAALLDVEPTQALAREAAGLAEQIRTALEDALLRSSFEDSAPARLVARLGTA